LSRLSRFRHSPEAAFFLRNPPNIILKEDTPFVFYAPIIALTMKDTTLPPAGEERTGEQSPARGEEVFDYHGLAAYLKIPEGTLRHWVMEGRIPFSKLGVHVRFSKSVIDRWFKEHQRDCRAAGKKTGGKKGVTGQGGGAPEGRSLFEEGGTG
jgi:excisionase family DNA binding protein